MEMTPIWLVKTFELKSNAVMHFIGQADNQMSVFVDDQYLGLTLNYDTVLDTTVFLTAGKHQIKICAINLLWQSATPSWSLGGVIAVLLYNTDSDVCVKTDDTWLWMAPFI